MWVDTETRERQIGPNLVSHHLWYGWAAYQRRTRGSAWTAPEWFRFENAVLFWEWIFQHVRPRTQMFLYAHNWSFDGPVLHTFSLLPDFGWELTRGVIQSPPIILKWRQENRTITMLDTLNWWRCSLAQLGESIGVAKLPMPTKDASGKVWDTYCRQDVEVIRVATHHWWEVLEKYDLGGYANTIAGQAVRAYRHRFLDVPILIDSCDEALQLARDALHGGRTEMFRQGRVEGPIYALDVNAMYPHVMREQEFPTVLRGHMRQVQTRELHAWLKHYALTAEVEIETTTPDYGHVHEDRLCFPIGRLRTVLTTPDLLHAIRHGHLRRVLHCALYDHAPIFRSFVDAIYKLRRKAQREGNRVHSDLLKKLMNSLYGKFAQRGEVWEVVDHIDDDSAKVWDELDYETGSITPYRQLAGCVQKRIALREAPDSHPAIAAHVTAYARQALRRLIRKAGPPNVLYVDTDSLYVREAGFRGLQDEIDPGRLGALKLEATLAWMVIHGAKDYMTPSKTVTKGVRARAEWIDLATVKQDKWSTLKGLVQSGQVEAPTTEVQVKHLSRLYTKGAVHPDGSVTPLRLSEW